MRRKITAIIVAIVMGGITWAIPYYIEVNNMITQENSHWLLLGSIAGIIIMVCILIWGFWPMIKRIRFQKPIIMSGVNQGQEGQIPFAKVSQQENKLALVAKAIMDAKQLTPVGTDTPVYITDSNGLTRIYPQELKGILVKFQNDERVITLKSFPEWLLPIELKDYNTAAINKRAEVALDPSKNHFVVNVLDTFDKWYKTIIKK